MIDYLISDKGPKRLERATYYQMKKKSELWTKSLEKKGLGIIEVEKDTEVVLDFKDGFRIVKLIGKPAYEREGFLMRHCVASYFGNGKEIYSLRDKDNIPHCTIEKDQQIKGKGNGSIHPKYIEYVCKFLEWSGMEVKDNEMKNLGYINVNKIKKTAINTVIPCIKLKVNVLLLNNESRKLRGGRFIIFFSSDTASKTVEHAGSIINSKNAICAGNKIIGKLNKTGSSDIPAIGICTANIYDMAFFKLS